MGLSFREMLETPDRKPAFSLEEHRPERFTALRGLLPLPRLRRRDKVVAGPLSIRGVPTRFVRYPRTTSHGMSRSGPADMRIHRLEQISAWWKRWLAR